MTNPIKPVGQRIDRCFESLRSQGRKGFIPYICAGDPDLAATVSLSLALEQAGADILELGVPFSDPLADGIVNQLAAQRALAAGTTVRGVIDCVRNIRKQSEIPIVLYTYLNPILQFGFEKFHGEASAAGVDALLMLDLPPEEEENSPAAGLAHIRLIAPTTSIERIGQIAAKAQGFLYYVSREGVTGVRQTMAADLQSQVARIRKLSNLPIAVGFGISTAEQARVVAKCADAVVVGSAIVSRIAEYQSGSTLIQHVVELVTPLVQAIKQS